LARPSFWGKLSDIYLKRGFFFTAIIDYNNFLVIYKLLILHHSMERNQEQNESENCEERFSTCVENFGPLEKDECLLLVKPKRYVLDGRKEWMYGYVSLHTFVKSVSAGGKLQCKD
jgi:hypothetical protein